MEPVLDYSHYVEMIDEEHDACLSRCPADILRPINIDGITDSGCWRFVNTRDAAKAFAEYDDERREVFGTMDYLTECPMCSTPLTKPFRFQRPDGHEHFGAVTVYECPRCGWWEFCDEYELLQEGDSYRARELRRRALLTEFSVGGSDIPIESLRKHLCNHEHSMYHLAPKALERLVADVWRDHMDCEAIHVGGPNDKGIDVVLIRGSRRYAIQVKRRTSPRLPEAIRGIREFVGALILNEHVRGIYVTTAPRFSEHAIEAADLAASVSNIENIDLVDGRKLLDVCKRTAPESFWTRFTRNLDEKPKFEIQYTFFRVHR